MDELPLVHMYTDGACEPNPGSGGWGAILQYKGREREVSGSHPNTTNQRMEMSAVLYGLQALKVPCRVYVYSDSAYVINFFVQKWYVSWAKNDWMLGKKTKKRPVANRDLWEALLVENQRHKISWNKVKGHSGHIMNDRADELASRAIIRGEIMSLTS